MRELVLVLSKSDKEHIAIARCEADLLVGEDDYDIWVRGISSSSYLASAAKLLPAKETYFLDLEGNLFPANSTTPLRKIEDLKWSSIENYCRVDMPTSALPGRLETQYQIKLKKSEIYKETSALLTSLGIFKTYTETAPEVRLKAIEFAVSDSDKVLIRGYPLPPIPGEEFWKAEDQVFLPAGYEFEMEIVSKLLSGKAGIKDSVLLFHPSSDYELIPLKNFVVGSRSAVRLTK